MNHARKSKKKRTGEKERFPALYPPKTPGIAPTPCNRKKGKYIKTKGDRGQRKKTLEGKITCAKEQHRARWPIIPAPCYADSL
jgi:hypothetical protein